MNTELNSPELIAQWVIDNRYPKSENEKIDDREMYIVLTESISQLLNQRDKMREMIKEAIHYLPYDKMRDEFNKYIESTNP